MIIQSVRGTQDALDLKIHNYLKNLLEQHLAHAHFKPIQTPILEHTKLFIHSLGEQTDVVSKEMYVFAAAEGEDSIALRPEGTASIIRAYLENSLEEQPWKVFSYGPMFRRERPQKGRWREFMQWSIEVVASPSVAQDALFLAMLNSFFAKVIKLENYTLHLNFLSCTPDRVEHKAALTTFLEQHKAAMCATCTLRKEKNILRIFDCKNETCKTIYRNAPKISDHQCTTCKEEWTQVKDFLTTLNIPFVHDVYLVRGLDYYVGTAFEFVSNELGAQSTFCGGGRYQLAQQLGSSKPLPSLGAGIGMGRLMMLFESVAAKHAIPESLKLHLIIPFEAAYVTTALELAQQLLAANLCTDVIVDTSSVKNMMKKANKMNAAVVLLLGEEEFKTGNIMVKDMTSGEGVLIAQNKVVEYLKRLS